VHVLPPSVDFFGRTAVSLNSSGKRVNGNEGGSEKNLWKKRWKKCGKSRTKLRTLIPYFFPPRSTGIGINDIRFHFKSEQRFNVSGREGHAVAANVITAFRLCCTLSWLKETTQIS
jgi:hypothetical protein